LSAPDLLHADDLHSRLGTTRIIGRDIRVFEETTSTNDMMARLASDGMKEGAVVFAEAQSRGRGRLGRRWISPARKGLWFSILLRPDLAPQAATQLTVAAATALARAIALQTGLVPEIKWPNDILIGGKKVAGILTELTAELDHVKEVVLGIGVDVNLDAAEMPRELRKTATSLKIECGQALDRAELAVAILRELDGDYERIRRGQFELVAGEWQQRCGTLGREVSIRIGERVIRGRAEALDGEGALLLRTQHGHLERIIGGDVTMEKEGG
jgi:BirA family biotin operon repressor/biotin-[acetyl-CoA-carboxylase] ligase